MTRKNTTLFYHEWIPLINSLDDKKRLQFYDLIFSLNSELPKIEDTHLASIFNFVATKIIENNKKYELEIEKRREAGAMGGKAKQANLASASKCYDVLDDASKIKQDLASLADKDNVKDKDKELINNQFEEFWNLYDYKKSKPKTLIAFEKSLKKDSFKNILAGVNAYIKSRGTDKQYWKHPTTWLNAEAWKDEYLTKQDNNLCQEINTLSGSELLTKIEKSGSKAALHFAYETDYKELIALPESIRNKIKEKISKTLGTEGYDFIY